MHLIEATSQIVLVKKILLFCCYSSTAERCVSMVTDYTETLCNMILQSD